MAYIVMSVVRKIWNVKEWVKDKYSTRRSRVLFYLETTLLVPCFPYSTSLGNALACIENFLRMAYLAIIKVHA